MNEEIEALRKASHEIKMLRAHIERLAPKAEAYEALAQVLGMIPRHTGGMGEDVAAMLDKMASRLEAKRGAMQALNVIGDEETTGASGSHSHGIKR